MHTCKKLTLSLATFLGALGTAAVPAVADDPPRPPVVTTSDSTASCTSPVLRRPFTGFGDWRSYVLAPGASFEGGSSGWSLRGGAAIGAGNERWHVNAPGDSRSLHLPAGAIASSPVMCVDETYPTMRLFAQSFDRAGAADLNVWVYYPDHRDQKLMKVRTYNAKAYEGWRLTSDIDVKPDTMSTSGYSRAIFMFEVKAEPGRPGYRIDDLFVDPRRSG